MATPVYTYTVHDLATNALLGELPLKGVRYGKKLNGSGSLTGSFTVESRYAPRRLVKDPNRLTTPARTALYVWRDEVPQWGGIIWTRRYDSRTRQVQIGAGDWWSYFDHRKILPVLSLPVDPTFEVAELVVTYTGIDQNAIARNLINLAQSHTGGDIGIITDTSTSLIPRDRTYRGYETQDVGEALRQLAGVLNGPDMMFDVGPLDDGNPTRVFKQGDPHMGQQGSPWVWEYGGNLVDYVWPTDGSRYASRVLAGGEGTVEGTPIAVAEDNDVYALGYPLIEAETSYSTVSNPDVLQAHADADQEAARLPVVLPVLEVRGDMNPILGAWSMGDDARVVIEDDFFPNQLDTAMRIIAADVSPPDDGTDEKISLTMSPLFDSSIADQVT